MKCSTKFYEEVDLREKPNLFISRSIFRKKVSQRFGIAECLEVGILAYRIQKSLLIYLIYAILFPNQRH